MVDVTCCLSAEAKLELGTPLMITPALLSTQASKNGIWFSLGMPEFKTK